MRYPRPRPGTGDWPIGEVPIYAGQAAAYQLRPPHARRSHSVRLSLDFESPRSGGSQPWLRAAGLPRRREPCCGPASYPIFPRQATGRPPRRVPCRQAGQEHGDPAAGPCAVLLRRRPYSDDASPDTAAQSARRNWLDACRLRTGLMIRLRTSRGSAEQRRGYNDRHAAPAQRTYGLSYASYPGGVIGGNSGADFLVGIFEEAASLSHSLRGRCRSPGSKELMLVRAGQALDLFLRHVGERALQIKGLP